MGWRLEGDAGGECSSIRGFEPLRWKYETDRAGNPYYACERAALRRSHYGREARRHVSNFSVSREDYAIGIDQLFDTEGGHGAKFDRKDLDVKVKVGWVKGLNRLYFLYEAYDNGAPDVRWSRP
jgi:hypothetical protein